MKKIDKFWAITFISMFILFLLSFVYVDVSLIFKMEYLNGDYWFISYYEILILLWVVIGINIGYSVCKIKYDYHLKQTEKRLDDMSKKLKEITNKIKEEKENL